ncbi:MAG: adenylate/guanylate cyclase domain-containing protein [Chloroflexota bacterium]|nr:MAG: adenylate/guanylate cyclase domain-containing protein [Chloroflexota bacterium]
MPLPEGVVTFLLTDIEGSTRLWEQDPERMRVALARHDAIIEQAAVAHNGHIVKPRGEGDSRFLVFAQPIDAIRAAAAIQRGLAATSSSSEIRLQTRVAIHHGAADLHDGDYYGPTVNRCARIRAIIHGGQIVISEAVATAVTPTDGLTWRDLGTHRLKDLSQPEHLHQVEAPGLRFEFPHLASLDAIPNNLPLQTSSFVGRERETREALDLLGNGRLLTMIGAGGSGKTRLAVHVAAESVDAFPDGVCFVELAAIVEAQQVGSTIAAVIGARETPGRALNDTLVDVLRPRKVLLILDNCEHVVADVAAIVTGLLRACPGVRIIATSRERLAVDGEQIYRVPSLGLPGEVEDLRPARALECESVRLFVERARAVDPSFALTDKNVGAVAKICRRLDGIPLAIELAAARARSLAPHQIADRLDDRFRLLTGGARAGLPRQQTLRAMVDWSHDVLGAAEKAVFRRLAVFAGGFTIEAAEQVCASDDVADFDVLDIVTNLVDRSLVAVDGASADQRFRLLETIRAYALDRLRESGEDSAARSRHFNWFANWLTARFAGQDLIGVGAGNPRESGRLYDEAEIEYENARVALDWGLTDPSCRIDGARMTSRLRRFHLIRGHASEGRRWCDRYLDAGVPDQRVEWYLRSTGMNLAFLQGDYAAAHRLGAPVVIAAGTDDAIPEVLLARHQVAILRVNEGDAGAFDEIRAVGVIAERLDLRLLQSFVQNFLAIGERLAGRHDAAMQLHGQAMAFSRETGDLWTLSHTQSALGLTHMARGDYAAARGCFTEVLAMRRELADQSTIPWSLTNLGDLASAEGDLEGAARNFGESLISLRRLGDRLGQADALASLGRVHRRRGDLTAATDALRESLTLRRDAGHLLAVPEMLVTIGAVALDGGNADRALRLLGAAESLAESLGVTLGAADQAQLADLRDNARTLAGATADAAYASGRANDRDAAIALGLT